MNLILRPRRPGFTLLELMIVIVILGILASAVVPRVLNRPEQARRTRAVVDIRNIEAALALFKTDTGNFPTTAQGFQALVTDPGVKGWDADGYLKQLPKDPWGRDYIYVCPSVHGRDFDLKSLGKDGEPGGTGYNADIENWNLDQTEMK